jgi:hypothetical protein
MSREGVRWGEGEEKGQGAAEMTKEGEETSYCQNSQKAKTERAESIHCKGECTLVNPHRKLCQKKPARGNDKKIIK